MIGLLNPTGLVANFGYLAIFVLSVAQSCCIPTSSELTLGFAGVLAAGHKLSLAGTIAAGVTGEVLGAYLAWWVGRNWGRAVVDRYGRYLLLSHRDLDRAEAWYRRHGLLGVAAGRCLPVIRNFAALPAGLAGYPAATFGLFTLFGSVVWDGAMAAIGYEIGKSYQSVMHDFSAAGYILLAAAVVGLAAVILHRYSNYGKTSHAPSPARRRKAGEGASSVPAASSVRLIGRATRPDSEGPCRETDLS